MVRHSDQHTSQCNHKPTYQLTYVVCVDDYWLKPIEYRIKDLALTVLDKKELQHSDWLTDHYVNTLNKILSKKYPSRSGLQGPLLLGELLTYN